MFERRRAGWEMLWEGSQKAFEIDWRGSTPLTTRANMCVCICATYSFLLFFLSLSFYVFFSLVSLFFFHIHQRRQKRPLVYVLRIITSSLPLVRFFSLSLSLSLIGRWFGLVDIKLIFHWSNASIPKRRKEEEEEKEQQKVRCCLSEIVNQQWLRFSFYTLVTISLFIDWLWLRLICGEYLSWIVKREKKRHITRKILIDEKKISTCDQHRTRHRRRLSIEREYFSRIHCYFFFERNLPCHSDFLLSMEVLPITAEQIKQKRLFIVFILETIDEVLKINISLQKVSNTENRRKRKEISTWRVFFIVVVVVVFLIVRIENMNALCVHRQSKYLKKRRRKRRKMRRVLCYVKMCSLILIIMRIYAKFFFQINGIQFQWKDFVFFSFSRLSSILARLLEEQ